MGNICVNYYFLMSMCYIIPKDESSLFHRRLLVPYHSTRLKFTIIIEIKNSHYVPNQNRQIITTGS